MIFAVATPVATSEKFRLMISLRGRTSPLIRPRADPNASFRYGFVLFHDHDAEQLERDHADYFAPVPMLALYILGIARLPAEKTEP